MTCRRSIEVIVDHRSSKPRVAGQLNDPSTTLGFAIAAGVAAGLGWATLGLGVIALFERRPWSYIVVNGGYLTISFTAMGAVARAADARPRWSVIIGLLSR